MGAQRVAPAASGEKEPKGQGRRARNGPPAGSGDAPHPLTAHKGSHLELGPRPWQAAGPPRAGAACAELGLAAVTHGASQGVSSLSAPSLPAPEEFSTPRSPTLRLMTDRACHEGQILLLRSPTACCCSHRELLTGRGPPAPGCCKAGSAPTAPGWHSPDPWAPWAPLGSLGSSCPGTAPSTAHQLPERL